MLEEETSSGTKSEETTKVSSTEYTSMSSVINDFSTTSNLLGSTHLTATAKSDPSEENQQERFGSSSSSEFKLLLFPFIKQNVLVFSYFHSMFLCVLKF